MFERIKNLFSKKITLYVVLNQVEDSEETSIEYVVSNMRELVEYIDKKILMSHYDHFKLWCDLHNCKVGDPKKQEEYLVNILTSMDDEEKKKYIFPIKKISYDKQTVAAAIRMLNCCEPLNCSFELPIEKEYFNILFEEEKRG